VDELLLRTAQRDDYSSSEAHPRLMFALAVFQACSNLLNAGYDNRHNTAWPGSPMGGWVRAVYFAARNCQAAHTCIADFMLVFLLSLLAAGSLACGPAVQLLLERVRTYILLWHI
jgi:hypothetical protein